MTECDRCDETDINPRVELHNPKFSNGIVSKLVSRMVVCEGCHVEMKRSEDWTL